MKQQMVIAVCGKGGVGKTVLSGSLVRILGEKGLSVLAVDADPAMGLSYILGLSPDISTLGNVREKLIQDARSKKSARQIAQTIDYLVLESLIETQKFSFFAMGRPVTKGCFCPVNTLLKRSIKKLADSYDIVLVDAEAGIEQINREVMGVVDTIIALSDQSQRGRHSISLISQIVKDLGMTARLGTVINRTEKKGDEDMAIQSEDMPPLWGSVPEDPQLRKNDARGRSIFDLDADSPVLKSASRISEFLINI